MQIEKGIKIFIKNGNARERIDSDVFYGEGK